ncbi:MAG: hypothetical protein DRJ47_02155 [Thermoprotei archaeon]|nr:MAG: hypothetical protein DRJ47_02155 [Thermoprotei archaeon]
MQRKRRLQIIEYYNKLSSVYEKLYGEEQVAKYRVISRRVSPRGRIGDFGCGTGLYLVELARNRNVEMVVGIDASIGMLSKAKEKKNEAVELIAGDICLLPLRPNSLDFAYSITVIDDAETLYTFLNEVKDVLRSGILVLGVLRKSLLSSENIEKIVNDCGFKISCRMDVPTVKDIILVCREENE